MNEALMRAVDAAAKETPGRLGCHICDGGGEVWASYRADEQFSTASVIKAPLLAALAASVDTGAHRWDESVTVNPEDPAAGSGVIRYLSAAAYTLHDVATLMIIVSDNRATNLVIDLLGMEQVNAYFARAGWRGTVLGRRMFDFEARRRGHDNLSTPRDTADLFVRLLSGTLLSPAASETVLRIFRCQQILHKLPAWLPPDTPVANKTGNMSGVDADSGILFLPSGPVVVSVYINDVVAPPVAWRAIQRIGQAIVEQAAGPRML